MKWTQLLQQIFPFKFTAFYYTSASGAFASMFLFRLGKELHDAVKNLWIHSTAPGMNTVKRNSERRIPRKNFGELESETFSGSKFDPATSVSCERRHSVWPESGRFRMAPEQDAQNRKPGHGARAWGSPWWPHRQSAIHTHDSSFLQCRTSIRLSSCSFSFFLSWVAKIQLSH